MARHPVVLLAGGPSLASPLRQAGAMMLTVGNEPAEQVARIAEETARAGQDYGIVIAAPSPALMAWAQVQIGQGHSVVFLAATPLNGLAPAAKQLSLPVCIDDILVALGTDAVGGPVGATKVAPDLTTSDGPSAPWGNHNAQPAPAQAPAPQAPAPQAPAPQAPAPQAPAPQAPAPQAVPAQLAPDAMHWGGPIPRPGLPRPPAGPAGVLGPTGPDGAEVDGADVDGADVDGAEVVLTGPGPFDATAEQGSAEQGSADLVSLDGLEPVEPDWAADGWQFAVPEASSTPEPASYEPASYEPASAPAPSPAPATPVQPAERAQVFSVPSSTVATPGPAPQGPLPGPGMVTDQVFTRPAPGASANLVLAPVIIPFAGKGGVGKSTFAMALAQRASTTGAMRVVLVDANAGQGDQRKYLRVGQAYLPSIVDTVISGDPARGLVGPQRLSATRQAGLPNLGFGVVLAPTDSQADSGLVTPEVYTRVVQAMRSMSDLVIVDTQIVEAKDDSGMVDRFMVPELLAGAWGLGLSDTSVGVDNLLHRLYTFSARGIGPERLMVALNKVEESSGLNQEAMVRLTERYAAWMGSVAMDSTVATAFESGTIPTSAELAGLLDRVLWRVTGLDAFSPKQKPAKPANKRRWRFPWARRT